jgi:hypothetical protein
MANAVDCIGEPSDVKSIENTTVSGDDASTDVTLDFGNFTFVLVKDGEVWKITQLKALSPDIPADVTGALQLNGSRSGSTGAISGQPPAREHCAEPPVVV